MRQRHALNAHSTLLSVCYTTRVFGARGSCAGAAKLQRESTRSQCDAARRSPVRVQRILSGTAQRHDHSVRRGTLSSEFAALAAAAASTQRRPQSLCTNCVPVDICGATHRPAMSAVHTPLVRGGKPFVPSGAAVRVKPPSHVIGFDPERSSIRIASTSLLLGRLCVLMGASPQQHALRV